MQTKAFNHSSFRVRVRARAYVCVRDIQTMEQCVLGGWFAHSVLCNVYEQSHQETPSTCRWQKTDCTHRYVQQTLFNMVYMQNIHLANQAKTQR